MQRYEQQKAGKVFYDRTNIQPEDWQQQKKKKIKT